VAQVRGKSWLKPCPALPKNKGAAGRLHGMAPRGATTAHASPGFCTIKASQTLPPPKPSQTQSRFVLQLLTSMPAIKGVCVRVVHP
jgi:hypothetical protein